jgi:hypothetical protein
VRTSSLVGIAALFLASSLSFSEPAKTQNTQAKEEQESVKQAFSYLTLIMNSPTTKLVSYPVVDGNNVLIGEQKEYHSNGNPCPDVIIQYPFSVDALVPITQAGNVAVLIPHRFAREIFVKYPMHMVGVIQEGQPLITTPYAAFKLSRAKEGTINKNPDGSPQYVPQQFTIENNPLFDHKHCRPSIT